MSYLVGWGEFFIVDMRYIATALDVNVYKLNPPSSYYGDQQLSYMVDEKREGGVSLLIYSYRNAVLPLECMVRIFHLSKMIGS